MKVYILVVLLVSTIPSFGQYIEFSFPSPSPYISGLTFNGDLFALDSLSGILYRMNQYNGTVLDTISVPETPNSPVGLTSYGDTLWFAESGTGIVHKIDVQGNELAVYDLSDSGPQSITGLARGIWDDDMYIMDGSSTTIYVVQTPIGSYPLEVFLAIEDCPEVHDISGPIEYSQIAVACEDSISPVRIYYGPTSFMPLESGEYESAVGVASWDGCRFYFSDPEMEMIHRYCVNMGGITPSDPASFAGCTLTPVSNPSLCALEFRLDLRMDISMTLRLLDLSGRLIEEIPEENFSAGIHHVRFEDLSPGIYFCVAARNGLCARGVIVGGD